MRKRDYKNHFDNIKCRPEFKEKMEKILSSESDGEYADSVKDIEYAPKINYHRWTVLVASFILVVGLGGTVFYNIKNSVSEPIYSNIESSKNTADITESVELNCEVNFKIRTVTGESESSAFGKMSDSRFYEKDFGRLPDFIVNEISEQLQNCDWIEVSEDSMNFNSASVWVDDSEIDYSAPAVILSYMGEENFVCTVSKSGYVMIEDDNGKRYCENNLYYDIIETIAYYLPYCDWTSMVDGETGIALDTAFKNHADEIKLNGIINGLIYPSAMEKVLGLKFFECGEFEAYIQENGDLNICYKSIDDISCAIENNRVYFSSSAELYDEIARAVNAEEERFENTNQELFSLVDETIADNIDIGYHSSLGQDSQGFWIENVNTEKLCSAIKSLDWNLSGSQLPLGGCFIAGDFLITMDGKIYSSSESVLYSAENQDYSAINNAIDEIIKTDDVGYMMYLVASSESRFNTMSGDINLYYAESNIIGKGKFYYNSNNHDEYINIEGVSSSALFVMNQGEWVYSGKNQDNVDFSKNGFRFYDTPLIEYTWLKDVILSHLQAINTSEIKSVAVMETEYGYHFTLDYINNDGKNIVVSVNLDSIGNPTEVVISEYFTDDEGNNLSNTEILFSIGNGIGGGIVYDDPNFIIPQSSVNYSSKE